jgi:NAD(P)H-dependent flavin oxidoreductase YrpB (nitropropane dioxygenase family)
MSTRFTETVGCRYPLQLAGMGMVAGADLAAAVTNAGALGTFALHALPPEAFADALRDLGARCGGRPFAVNFLAPFLDRARLEAAAREARVVELFYGDPDADLVRIGHDGGALVNWQVGSVDEARAAVDAGCDIVTAQGTDAGGHVRGTRRLTELLPAVREAVSLPVVAAGGIATRDDVRAALDAGADAVRVGTRFLAAEEADVHPDYVQALIAARAPADTVLTKAFAVGWPDAPHRVLRSAAERAESLDAETVGELTLGDFKMPLPRLSTMPPTRTVTGDVAAMALYAGEGVGSVTRTQPAADIVRELMSSS